VAGTSSSRSVRCGSLSGASSGSELGSGISMTLTGLLVNPIDPALVFTVTKTAAFEAISYSLEPLIGRPFALAYTSP
jgi:hypothetical protein